MRHSYFNNSRMVTSMTLQAYQKAAMDHHGPRVVEAARLHSTVAAAVLAARAPKKAARAKVEVMVAEKVDVGLNGIVAATPRIGQPSAVFEVLQHEDGLKHGAIDL
mmetsp:Transcript_128798/g.257240  ORF Transcript_128798/g.257240 Transcript_128798/m.257240 type:complete len:106 (-) Transcript_128798:86-403(-)